VGGGFAARSTTPRWANFDRRDDGEAHGKLCEARTYGIHAFSASHSAAYIALKDGRERGLWSDFVNSLVMSSFCLGAYLNFAGEQIFSYWSQVERLSVQDKLGLICGHLQIEMDSSMRPYQSIKQLWSCRNFMAHARTETGQEEWKQPAGQWRDDWRIGSNLAGASWLPISPSDFCKTRPDRTWKCVTTTSWRICWSTMVTAVGSGGDRRRPPPRVAYTVSLNDLPSATWAAARRAIGTR
jgi:hypothetical protein